MIFFIVIVVPTFFVVLMNLIELLVERASPWERRTMKVGWDICVLALGLTGGLFADAEILKILQGQGGYHVPGFLLASIIVSLGMAILIALLRRNDSPSGLAAFFALLLGGITLILPTYLTLLR